MRLLTYIFLSLISLYPLYAQNPKTSSSDIRFNNTKVLKKLINNSLINNLPAKNIGPTVMSGRVVDLAVNPNKPSSFYAAFASGGLWFTNNNAQTYQPLFQEEISMTIGDIAVVWGENNTIWVGSGENNSSRSSYSGTGIYKSNDSGKTWKYMGLKDSHHIGRIIIHPKNPNIVWVAVLGHLYSKNEERGIYKTIDAGKTWQKVLFIDNETGFIDLAISPSNPEILYAASWQRERKSWNFQGSGEKSDIYKTIDSGKTWQKINTGKNGFPDNEGVGRIGLAVFDTNTLYALLDNQNRRSSKDKIKKNSDSETVSKNQLKNISQEDFLKLSDKSINAYLKKHNFPKSYNAQRVKKEIKEKKYTPKALVYYLGDANADLFDTPVKGAELYKSSDGGKTWKKTHKDYIDDLYYSYGYYFGQIRINPNHANEVYIMGVPILFSKDSGNTWTSINANNVHVDHHALWVHPKQAGYLINGNDGGINISYDNGKNWYKGNTIPVGQFYSVNIDNKKPFNVYGGLQDNGVWYGSNNYTLDPLWYQEGEYPYKRILGGDGMQVAVDTVEKDPIVYTGFQFGHYYKVNLNTQDYQKITPRHDLGEYPYRFNWQTPVYLSSHNNDVLYIGSNKFHRSLDKGKTYYTNPKDLTKGGKKGNVPFGTITTIDESPFQFGLIYIGTDDGLIHITRDGGYTWEKIVYGLPENYWISRVVASKHNPSRVYATLNGYRWDNFEPYIYVSEDYGKTWIRIGTNLPQEPVNVIKEDPENQNLLYLGTDNGSYISLNRGLSFMPITKNFPHVAVHDLVIQNRDKKLILGTHGRSLYTVDIKDLQQLNQNIINQNLHVFEIEDIKFDKTWGSKKWSKWLGYHEPKANWTFYTKKPELMTFRILTKDKKIIYEKRQKVDKGLNYFDYDLSISSKIDEKLFKKPIKKADNKRYYLPVGTFIFHIETNTKIIEQEFSIIDDRK